MILPELLPVLAIHLYALGTAAVVAGILARNEWLKRAALVLTVLAFTTHTLLLIATFMDDGFTGLTRSVYVQLLAWCITLSGLVAWLRWRYEALLLTVAPFSLLTFLIALLLRHAETPLPPVLSGMTFTIHIAAIFISIGLMALAFGAGVLFLIQAKSIKSKSKLAGFQKDLPALSALDKINAFTTTVGFPLFTAACFLGSSRPASIGAQSFPVILKSLFRSLSGACTLGFSTSGSRRAGKDANRQFWQYGSSRFARFRSSW